MANIELHEAHVDFPVFNAGSRSLKDKVLGLATGGAIDRSQNGIVLIKGLAGVSLSVADGERIGLVGHNGSGKTTLLRVLSGIYRPTRGVVHVDGECVSLINISLGIDPEATGRENIRLRAAMMGMSKSDLARQFDEIAEFTGLGDFLNMPLRTYSTGMQLRLAFSISTAVRPEILVMDEWLSTGDEDFKAKADKRLHDIVSTTNILILASHSRDLILRNCSRVVWMEHGKVKMDGPAEEIVESYFGPIDPKTSKAIQTR